MSDDTLLAPLCADCTSFPLYFAGQDWFCKSKNETVDFITTACPKQAERPREQSQYLVDLKCAAYERNTRTLLRLAEENKAAHEALEAQRAITESAREAERIQNEIKAEEERDRAREGGPWVYFVDCGPYTKIGFTTNPIKHRLKSFTTANPFDLRVYAIVQGSHLTESSFHDLFARYRHKLEWFELGEEGRAELDRLVEEYGGQFFSDDDS